MGAPTILSGESMSQLDVLCNRELLLQLTASKIYFLFDEICSLCIYTFFSCVHFSNFGLLFTGGMPDGWNTYRIISLSLLLGVWLFLSIFFVLTCFSIRFRSTFGLLSVGDKASVVLDKK
jgi:hypothetical protein